MRYSARSGPGPKRPLASVSGESGYRLPVHLVRDGTSLRMVAAMADPSLPVSAQSLFDGLGGGRPTPFAGEARESDREYFRRRSAEERRAAAGAAGPQARAAHEELAAHYGRLSEIGTRPRFTAGRPLASMLSRRFGLSGSDVGQEQERLGATHQL